MSKRILVAGASSILGRHIIDILKSRNYHVRALTRQNPDKSKLQGLADEVVQGDAFTGSGLDDAMEGMDFIISSVGASLQPKFGYGRQSYGLFDVRSNRNLIAAAKKHKVIKMGYVGLNAAERFLHLDYARAHHTVAQELADSGLEYAVIRPNGFFSGFATFLEMGRKGKVPLFGTGDSLNNPIHDRDVAEACVNALEGDIPVIDVGGPDIMTRREIVDLVFTTLNREPQIQNVSPKLLHGASLALRAFHPRISHLLKFAATVSVEDVVAPTTGSLHLRDYFAELQSAAKP